MTNLTLVGVLTLVYLCAVRAAKFIVSLFVIALCGEILWSAIKKLVKRPFARPAAA